MQKFSTRLAEAIAKSGKSKGALAASTGVALSTVSRWLGGAVPKAETIANIANFLGVDAKWLLLGESEERSAQRELTVADIEAMFSDPVFRDAWESASNDTLRDYSKRLPRILAEDSSLFRSRVLKIKTTTLSVFSELLLACELTDEDCPIEPGQDRLELLRSELALLCATVKEISPQLSEIILDGLALRDLAESSPRTLQILRESRNKAE